MKQHDKGRRDFLTGTIASAGVAASVALIPQASAQDTSTVSQPAMPGHAMAAGTDPAKDAMMHMSHGGHGAFFNDTDSLTIVALAERLMPGAPEKPGATDAGVLNYIDLALSGAYADLQDFYRRALAQLDAHCLAAYGSAFRTLDAAQQDAILSLLEKGPIAEFIWPTAQSFFNALRLHTMEGMFADPVYGGNKNFAGWRLIGFPGAQPQFTEDDIASGKAFVREPIISMQARAKSGKGI